MTRPIYMDCNATTPVDARVAELMVQFMNSEYGNSGSRTHIYGVEAARAVNHAREQVGRVVGEDAGSVIFTSGATESNNLALLGLAAWGEQNDRRHIVTTQIEHKAILEPLEALERRGFTVTRVAPGPGGWVSPESIVGALRPDTLLVSVMHANNETGVIQPIQEIADRLGEHEAFLHTDASQGFGKDLAPLRHSRIDMISISGHKIFGPKGVGALILRKRRFKRPPLEPLSFGGGQERGLRPGTVPVFLVVGLGLAAELAERESAKRMEACRAFKTRLLEELSCLGAQVNGDLSRMLPSTVNVSVPGLDSEAAILALKDLVAISNGSACTSAGHEPSHVLCAMGLSAERVAGALRWSWSHLTSEPDWHAVRAALHRVRI